jgi:hypothetical protein
VFAFWVASAQGKTALVSRFTNRPFPAIYSETKEALVHAVRTTSSGKLVMAFYD